MLFNHMNEGIVIFDIAGKLVSSNNAANKYGFSKNSINKLHAKPLFYQVDGITKLLPHEEPLQLLIAGAQETTQELWLVPEEGKAGSIVRIISKPLYSNKRILKGFMLVVHDITQSKWAEKRLEVSEQRFKSLFDHNPDIVLWFTLDGKLLSVNPALEKLVGFSPQELKNQTFDDLFTAAGYEPLSEILLKLESGEPLNNEATLTHKLGWAVYLQTTVIPITVDNQLVGVYVIAQDITAKKQSLKTIQQIAYFDTLTGLPNRHHFFEKLRTAIEQHDQQKSRSFALLFVDLDRFKLINDTLGHHAGDYLLTQTAKRMQACIASSDFISRLSGDEFIILLADSDASSALQHADQIRYSIARPVTYDNHLMHTSASIGISLYPEHTTQLETLVQYADMAMYRAKEYGKNATFFFDSEMNDAIIRRTTLEKELRSALTNNEFILHYQPQIDAQAGSITGLEALVRWIHPERGIVSPLEFIPLAEETGIIMALGEWVLREACFQNRSWIDAGLPAVTVAVNISMKQFQDEELFETIQMILEESRLPPSLLELEITESIGLQGTEQVIKKLTKLKTLGVRIAIDDFGTGYSSLHYLQKLPLDTLKIDKSFIKAISNERAGSSIVHSIIELAHSLQLDVLAEGVEMDSQHQKLVSFGCNRLQGFLFSPPVTAEKAKELLAAS
ncbi:sensor domain-containing protein [Paenibacillus sinopodophylli]|uniref:sensor domain-containing protein n=1 Tax=Paenibacillus sinopodophylli TaxID=1837342 RepID=UPI001486BABF|nr:bifunctional diguanylate cyclase/phosphodiesterase [Paenibacillus sinopodophylli]